MFDTTQITFGLLIVSILVGYGNSHWGIPLIAVVNRWLRWVVFSLLIALLVTRMEWAARPFWSITAIAFLGWFLLESMYTWIVISALSRSPIPLFPKFRPNDKGDEWPAQKKFIAIRDWLRSNGFKKLESVKAEIEDPISIRSTIYQDVDNTIRLQVLFFPQRAGYVRAAYILSSRTTTDEYVLTDNVHLPFGGFYPENWFIVRKPLMRSLEHLMRLHRRRLKGKALQHWSDEDPVSDINRQQAKLEQANLQLGFLIPHNQQEGFGRLTKEGRYRIWKEVWLLNYFGMTVQYESH